MNIKPKYTGLLLAHRVTANSLKKMPHLPILEHMGVKQSLDSDFICLLDLHSKQNYTLYMTTLQILESNVHENVVQNIRLHIH